VLLKGTVRSRICCNGFHLRLFSARFRASGHSPPSSAKTHVLARNQTIRTTFSWKFKATGVPKRKTTKFQAVRDLTGSLTANRFCTRVKGTSHVARRRRGTSRSATESQHGAPRGPSRASAKTSASAAAASPPRPAARVGVAPRESNGRPRWAPSPPTRSARGPWIPPPNSTGAQRTGAASASIASRRLRGAPRSQQWRRSKAVRMWAHLEGATRHWARQAVGVEGLRGLGPRLMVPASAASPEAKKEKKRKLWASTGLLAL
jgi:hypothetical protein